MPSKHFNLGYYKYRILHHQMIAEYWRVVVFCWSSPTELFMDSGLIGSQDHILVRSNLFMCFVNGGLSSRKGNVGFSVTTLSRAAIFYCQHDVLRSPAQ
jgi:hypothetical protein